MGQTVHDYTMLLERVMCFGVVVEILTKQVRVGAVGSKKASSKHVLSGAFRISLDPSGLIPFDRSDDIVEQSLTAGVRRVELSSKLDAALKPIRESLETELKSQLSQAKTYDQMQHAIALSSVLKDLGEFRVLLTTPSEGVFTLSLSGVAVLHPPVADGLRPRLVQALESVLEPEREKAIAMVRGLALKALEQP